MTSVSQDLMTKHLPGSMQSIRSLGQDTKLSETESFLGLGLRMSMLLEVMGKFAIFSIFHLLSNG